MSSSFHLTAAWPVAKWWFLREFTGLIWWVFKHKGERMEKDVALGSVGKLALSFTGGQAVVGANVALPGGVAISFSACDDAGALIDQLEGIVAKALPATAAIDPAIFAVIKSAVLAIK